MHTLHAVADELRMREQDRNMLRGVLDSLRRVEETLQVLKESHARRILLVRCKKLSLTGSGARATPLRTLFASGYKLPGATCTDVHLLHLAVKIPRL
ncbi:unnamed protein product [Dicrocoelium dendriticum]|nr:unnamed protein product [Dicrocoelium dendriticum]